MEGGGHFSQTNGGQIFLHTWGMKISTHKRGDKQFYTGSSGNKNVSCEKGEEGKRVFVRVKRASSPQELEFERARRALKF